MTPKGREISSRNSLKHGLTAKTVVLPGEDPEILQARVDAWKDNLRPADDVQDYLIERAAHASWQLDRADRTIAARLSERVLHAPAERAAAEAEEVADLARRLFWDPAGHVALYPHVQNDNGPITISRCTDPDDPLDPAVLVARLEALPGGCEWLLDRWADLRELLEDGLNWQAPDRFKATRLLGKQPMEALDDRRLTTIHLACRAMEPEGGAAFADLKSELGWFFDKKFAERAEARVLASRMPADAAAGRAALLAVIDGATGRLEELLAYHKEVEEARAALGGDLDAFDDSREGELLRRYQLGKAREFQRAVDLFYKSRREAERHPADDAPEPPDETNPGRPAGPAPTAAVAPPSEPAAVADETNCHAPLGHPTP